MGGESVLQRNLLQNADSVSFVCGIENGLARYDKIISFQV
jgi:hypothetical protein